jgi:hypothetical protein
MPYYKRKQEENPWLGLSAAEFDEKYEEACQRAWIKQLRAFYDQAVAEGFGETFEDYKRQWEWPFREDGQANPRFEKSWDGSEAVRKSAETARTAVTLGTDQELQL